MRLIAKKMLRLVAATSMLAAMLALTAPTPASATEPCIATSTSDGGGTDRGDCVYIKVYTAVDGRIVVKYSGNQDYDFYQLRWSRPGRAERQLSVRGSGSRGSWWALSNAWENTPYTFKVQACYSDIIGQSDCTPHSWKTLTYRKWARAMSL